MVFECCIYTIYDIPSICWIFWWYLYYPEPKIWSAAWTAGQWSCEIPIRTHGGSKVAVLFDTGPAKHWTLKGIRHWCTMTKYIRLNIFASFSGLQTHLSKCPAETIQNKKQDVRRPVPVPTMGKISVNRSWKIPQSDHFYINQENGFCQDFVDCNGFFGLRVQLQVNKSVTILIQSRQSCCNSVQSSIVKCQYNPTKSIPIPAQFGYT